MGIICKQCGFENPDGAVICEICATDLTAPEPAPTPKKETASQAAASNTASSAASAPAQTAGQASANTASEQPSADGEVEYFVMCPESSSKTVVSGPDITKYFCAGCKREHEIDGLLWTVESRRLTPEPGPQTGSCDPTQPADAPKPTGDKVVLEEVTSHYRIEIPKPGGPVGRYDAYGSDFFLSRSMHTISSTHVEITNEYGEWVIRHKSQVNETRYNNEKLERDEPHLLEDGKMLTLANTVTFIVHLE